MDKHDVALGRLFSLKAEEIDLSAIYEAVLGYEFCVANGAVVAEVSKAGRNRLGGYYTPASLAKACVRRTLDQYVEQHLGLREFSRSPDETVARNIDDVLELLVVSRVMDFSCGAGQFLVAYLEYVADLLGRARLQSGGGCRNSPTLRDVAAILHGMDVDPIALDIARCELALVVQAPELMERLRDNFHHANPLLRAPRTVPPGRKLSLFRKGFVYHAELGLRPNTKLGSWNIVIGNPPWEKIRLEQRSFFRFLAPEVHRRTRKDARQRAIDALAETAPEIHSYYVCVRDRYEQARHQLRSDKRFLYASRGELNSYALFAELALGELAQDGVVGLLVKSGLFTTTCYSKFFNHLVDSNRLVAVFDFINSRRLFAIDSRERFSFMLAGTGNRRLRFATGLTGAEQLESELPLIPITRRILRQLNPSTGMLPNTASAEELEDVLQVVGKNRSFTEVYPDARFGRIVHLSTHANHIRRQPGPERLPIYEGKFLEQYDGRFAGFASVPKAKRYTSKARAAVIPEEDKLSPSTVPEPRFYIDASVWSRLTAGHGEPWSLMWRSTTSASNRRTCIATILPHGPAIQSIQFLQLPGGQPIELAVILGVMNSVAFDYVLRRKLNGIDLTQSVVRQMPVPSPERWEETVRFGARAATLRDHVLWRVSALLRDDARLDGFCARLGTTKAARREDRRGIRRELDLLAAFAYRVRRPLFLRMCEDLERDLGEDDMQWLQTARHWPTRARK